MPNKKDPKISVVTPSFNQGKYIEQTILSVLGQGYGNLEYIVMDGGSTDGTVDIIRKYSSRITYWESKPDKGQSDAIRRGFSRATGDILAYINSDDVYFPRAFEAIAGLYRERPSAAIYSGGMAVGDLSGRIKTCTIPSELPRYFSDRGITGFGQPSSFFNAGLYRATSGIDVEIYTRMDSDLMYKLLKVRPESVVTDELISFFRWHPASKSTLSVDRYLQECARFREERGHTALSERMTAILFSLNRLLRGGYFVSLAETLKMRGKLVSEVWGGRL